MAPLVAYERQACLGIYTTLVKIQHGYYVCMYVYFIIANNG